MTIVAVSQRVEVYPERNEQRDSLDQKVSEWLYACGYFASPVPNGLIETQEDSVTNCGDFLNDWLETLQPEAILLSGGEDIGTSIARDNTERVLLSYGEKHALPVLGICRGMQFIGVSFGTALKAVEAHIGTTHSLRGEISGPANSYHRFSLNDCPTQFNVLAYSEDGEIEAIGHENLPLEAWMWHPERENDFCARDIERLRKLFDQ